MMVPTRSYCGNERAPIGDVPPVGEISIKSFGGPRGSRKVQTLSRVWWRHFMAITTLAQAHREAEYARDFLKRSSATNATRPMAPQNES